MCMRLQCHSGGKINCTVLTWNLEATDNVFAFDPVPLLVSLFWLPGLLYRTQYFRTLRRTPRPMSTTLRITDSDTVQLIVMDRASNAVFRSYCIKITNYSRNRVKISLFYLAGKAMVYTRLSLNYRQFHGAFMNPHPRRHP